MFQMFDLNACCNTCIPVIMNNFVICRWQSHTTHDWWLMRLGCNTMYAWYDEHLHTRSRVGTPGEDDLRCVIGSACGSCILSTCCAARVCNDRSRLLRSAAQTFTVVKSTHVFEGNQSRIAPTPPSIWGYAPALFTVPQRGISLPTICYTCMFKSLFSHLKLTVFPDPPVRFPLRAGRWLAESMCRFDPHKYTRLVSNLAPTWSFRCCFTTCHF